MVLGRRLRPRALEGMSDHPRRAMLPMAADQWLRRAPNRTGTSKRQGVHGSSTCRALDSRSRALGNQRSFGSRRHCGNRLRSCQKMEKRLYWALPSLWNPNKVRQISRNRSMSTVLPALLRSRRACLHEISAFIHATLPSQVSQRTDVAPPGEQAVGSAQKPDGGRTVRHGGRPPSAGPR
jgi:hypothetical protein